MILDGDAGDRFELRIAGYQYSEARLGADAGDHDRNWLFIVGSCVKDGRGWRFHDAALMTWEVELLADWLDGRGRWLEDIDFIEPVLAFSRVEPDALRLHLSHESRPPWAPHRFEGDFYTDVGLGPEQAASASRSLRAMLEEYPRR